ncbi:MAG: ABC transporter substrate-binding protein [Deltaproteobacteria bacterium]|nr:ABC transporter substrate-binding protein [Deltaproteobacteria bacterium]MBW2085329.1 ABC transporter substrate-binding protein [Deltaproteobacteria bacterium]
MRRSSILTVIIVLVLIGSYLGQKYFPEFRVITTAPDTDREYNRIVSLAPSITEMLFVLSLGDRVVGVTRFCKYPPEALSIAKMGGFYDPNYEAVIASKPDLVILSVEHQNPRRHLTSLGLNVLVVNYSTLSGILDSLSLIGRACGVQEKAKAEIATLKKRMDLISNKTEGLPRLSVLVSISRSMGSDTLTEIYIAGRDEFYDEMITLAGGRNAYGGKIKYPTVSGEGIISLNPEVIIDLAPETGEQDLKEAVILKEWQRFSNVDAVKNGRVHVFRQGFMVIPGPRFILTLEALARALHPEVKWDEG